jgi:hypothetical protein
MLSLLIGCIKNYGPKTIYHDFWPRLMERKGECVCIFTSCYYKLCRIAIIFLITVITRGSLSIEGYGDYNVLVGARDGRTQSACAFFFFFFPTLQTHPPKNLNIWSLIPSDTVKSPGFFKPRGTHKGAKQPLKKKKKKSFVTKIRWKVPNENIHGEASFYYYYYFLCVFCFYFVFILTFIFLFI